MLFLKIFFSKNKYFNLKIYVPIIRGGKTSLQWNNKNEATLIVIVFDYALKKINFRNNKQFLRQKLNILTSKLESFWRQNQY
jgi:hypothetical protein